MDQADELRKKAGTDNPSAFDIARVSGVTGSAAPEAKEFVSNLEKEATLKNQQDLKDESIAAQKDAAEKNRQAAAARQQDHDDLMKALATQKSKGQTFSSDDITDGTPAMDIVDALGTGRMTFDMMTKTYPGFSKNAAKREAILEKTMEKYPDFSPTQQALEYKWGSNAKAITTIAAANNALSNIDKVVEMSDMWKRSGSPAFNNLLKETQFQLGDKNVTNIKELQTAVGDEVAGVLGYGSSSDLKTRLGLDLMNPNVSAENFQSNMKILKHLLENRAKTMAAPMGNYGNRPGIEPVQTKFGSSGTATNPDVESAKKKYGISY
jgi:hypothetical protein